MTSGLCQELITQLGGFIAQSMDCGPEEGGFEVITTPFFYPDRDNIEVFVQELDGGRVLISDLGQTMMKLSSYGFVPGGNTPRRRAMIYQVVNAFNVQYEDGSVVAVVDRLESGRRLWDVAMAIQRLSDLVFTVPGFTKATFADEFQEFLVEKGLGQYQRGVPVRLPDHAFTADFASEDKVLQLVSAGSPGYAHERISNVYVNFTEMQRANDRRQRLAVIDDRQPVVDAQLRQLLSHQADRVLIWGRRMELERVLRNAAA